MLKIIIKTPGIPFQLLNGEIVRTPFDLVIPEDQKVLYKSRLKNASIKDFEIVEAKEEDIGDGIVDSKKLSLKKKIGSDLNIGISIKQSAKNL